MCAPPCSLLADWDVVTQDDLGTSVSLCLSLTMWRRTILLTMNTCLGMLHDYLSHYIFGGLAYPKEVYSYQTIKTKL